MKTISALFCLVCLGLFAACAVPTAVPTPTLVPPTSVPPTSIPPTPIPTVAPMSRVLRVGQGTYPDVFDPQKSSFLTEIAILQLAYEGLTRLDEKGNVIPGAAETWESSADGKQMTFHLRAGLKRADGTPMGCADFEYALKREVDPAVTGKQYTGIVYDIQGAEELDALMTYDPSTLNPTKVKKAFSKYGVRCTDDHTLQVTYKRPVNDGAYLASMMVAFPTDKRAADADPDAWWTYAEGHNGNGMFRITEIVEGEKIVFEANPDYWGGRPKLDRIEFVYNNDPAVLLEQYQRGELDMLALDPDTLKTVQADPTLASQLVRYPAASVSGIQFDHGRPPFNDRNVRIAFSQALDRKGWVREVNGGIGVPYTRWIPPGVPGAQPDVAGVPAMDARAAVKTLVDNGYAAADSTAEQPKVDCAKLGELKIAYGQSTQNNIRFKFLANNLETVFGCPVVLDPIDPTCCSALLNESPPFPLISRVGWIQDYPHPNNWLSTYWTCNGFGARSEYCNSDFDALVARADETPNLEDALPLYRAAEDFLLADVPAAIINYRENVYLVAPYLLGFREHKSTSDAAWVGQYGPILDYDIDLTQVPDGYPKE